MARHTQSDRNQGMYRTHDGRLVSREEIERALLGLTLEEPGSRHWEWVRIWAVTIVIVLILLSITAALVWWRLTTPS